MKGKNVLFIVTTLAMIFAGCHTKAKRAQEYHDKLLYTVRGVIDSSLDYGDAIQSYSKDPAYRSHERYSDLVNTAISKINEAKDFEGDTILLHYSLELLGFYKNSLDHEFKPFLLSLTTESFTDQEKHIADSLYMNFTDTQSKYWARFEWAEKKFDRKYQLEMPQK